MKKLIFIFMLFLSASVREGLNNSPKSAIIRPSQNL